MSKALRGQIVVVGSGAGGATTACSLAQAGFDVVVLEEGMRHPIESYGCNATDGMRRFYRNRGMTPIVGGVPIGYVEGCCLGGSTEVNCGFWHRVPPEVALRWRAQYDLQDCEPDDLEPHFCWAEEQTSVSPHPEPLPASTQVFARGIEAMGWRYQQVPRTARGCIGDNTCASGCRSGAKQSMARTLIPAAEAAGARFLTGCKATMLLRRGSRVTGVLAEVTHEDGSSSLARIDAEHVFVCAGPTQTPSLLRRSGIKFHVGDTLRIHPMLKVAARFDEPLDSQSSVLPLLQVKEFWPDLSIGGAFYSSGHLAMLLSDNWPETSQAMNDAKSIGAWYVAVKGNGKGSVRPSMTGDGAPMIRYELSNEDLRHLSQGLARLATLLLAAGAREVFPSVHGIPTIRSKLDAIRWLDDLLPRGAVSLTTVHAFSSCPIGERNDRCAADSFGRVHGFEGLYINDASILPDSPGVNPQGTVMALARRNALHFAETMRNG
ncbi:MAG: GMC family oxidoreductase [Deltaproteobacteria bacterium]|nr:GMC family oxidoreductase [Deltaproteobacteria bacterium]